MSALEMLEVKRAKVQERAERVAADELAARESPRRGERERERLLAYHRECGEHGREPEANVERDLGAALAEATGGLVTKAVKHLDEGGQVEYQERLVDPVAEARLEGSRAALRDAQGELQGFIAASLAEIAVERAEKAQEVAQACEKSLRAVRSAATAYETERLWWTKLLVEGKQDPLLAEIPENTLAIVAQAPRDVPLPMPEVFTA